MVRSDWSVIDQDPVVSDDSGLNNDDTFTGSSNIIAAETKHQILEFTESQNQEPVPQQGWTRGLRFLIEFFD